MGKESSNAHTTHRKPKRSAGLLGGGPKVGTTAGQGPELLAPRNVARMHRTHGAHVLGYVPAVAHFGKVAYVDLYALHPDTGALKRKRYKLDRIAGAAERKRFARDLVDRLNDKLRRGWNPWAADEAPKSMHTVREAVEQYVDFKCRTTRHSAPHSYKMTGKRFLEWATAEGLAHGPVANIHQQHAHRYIDHLHITRGISNNTHNGYLTFVRGMFQWMIQRGFRSDNPFRTVARLRKTTKTRVFLTPEDRKAAIDWFREHDPDMVLVCLFTFHTLIRPRQELSRLKVGMIDLHNNCVRFDDGGDTKSGQPRTPAMPDSMKAELVGSAIATAPPNWFAVGDGLKPGPKRMGYNMGGNRWDKMRKALGWPNSKQLYSLRDSGIIQLLRDGVSIEVVMRQAGHRSLATTNAYVQHAFPDAQREVISKASAF